MNAAFINCDFLYENCWTFETYFKINGESYNQKNLGNRYISVHLFTKEILGQGQCLTEFYLNKIKGQGRLQRLVLFYGIQETNF